MLRKTNRGPKEEEKSESSSTQVLISAIITPHVCVMMLTVNTVQVVSTLCFYTALNLNDGQRACS